MTKRIAVVDDEELIRWSLQKQLLAKGFEVETFGSGEEAIEFFKRGERADLVITDFKMPGRNGLETTREIKKYM